MNDLRRNACENKNPEDLEIESKRFAKKIRKHSVELPCHCAHSGNRQEAREQRLYLEGLAFRVTFLRVLGLMLGLLVFGQVFHRFCHVFLIFCSIFARDSWMDCFEAHHGLNVRKSRQNRPQTLQNRVLEPLKSSLEPSKTQFLNDI